MSQHDPPRRASHLMDPNAPRPPTTKEDRERLANVQKWVMSVLAATTILHLAAGLSIAAIFIDGPNLPARIGLNILAMAFGVIAVATARAIHRLPLLSVWLLLGLVPGLIGLWITFA